ncbi:hypothetical protein ACNTMW_22330 [Planosporangium sp. 12N6]|uniref:hypothetical protein n=1 Tax=Planosporangium spinosum TaxID=3402278 RepID=UPI003CECEED1
MNRLDTPPPHYESPTHRAYCEIVEALSDIQITLTRHEYRESVERGLNVDNIYDEFARWLHEQVDYQLSQARRNRLILDALDPDNGR